MKFLHSFIFLFGFWSISLASDRQTGTVKVLNAENFTTPGNSTSSQNVPTPLIVGGTEANRGEFPWIVYLKIDNGKGSYSFCGGTLIERDLVLTAAHCIITQGSVAASRVQVTAGDHDLTYIDGREQFLNASGVKIHEDYKVKKGGSLENDIALVKLSRNFNLISGQVSTIAYNRSGSSSPTGSGIVAGWGTTSSGGTMSNKLLKVTVPIVSNSDSTCKRLLTNANAQICAGQAGRDACQGDSGGPFLCSADGHNTVCGIVSYGEGCAEKNNPGVYTKVSYYYNWIQQKKNGTFDRYLPSSSADWVTQSKMLFAITGLVTVLLSSF